MSKKTIFIGFILTLFATSFFYSCSKNEETDLFSSVIKNNKGDFRNIILNSEITEIRKYEDKKALINETSELLEYKYKIDEKNSYSITYNFDSKGLYSIDIQIDIHDNPDSLSVKKGHKLYQKFFNRFQKKYGTPEKISDENYSWSFKSISGNNAVIQLTDNSNLDDYGSINIIIEAVQ